MAEHRNQNTATDHTDNQVVSSSQRVHVSPQQPLQLGLHSDGTTVLQQSPSVTFVGLQVPQAPCGHVFRVLAGMKRMQMLKHQYG